MKLKYIFGAMLIGFAAGACAGPAYSYRGLNYDRFTLGDSPGIPGSYNSSMKLVLSFELSASITADMPFSQFPVGSFSVSDGRFTKSDLGPDDVFNVFLSTDASGHIADWSVVLNSWDGPPLAEGSIFLAIATSNMTGGGVVDSSFVGICGSVCFNGVTDAEDAISSRAGVWIEPPSIVPLASSGLYFAPAFAAIGLMRRRAGIRPC